MVKELPHVRKNGFGRMYPDNRLHIKLPGKLLPSLESPCKFTVTNCVKKQLKVEFPQIYAANVHVYTCTVLLNVICLG